MTDEIRRAMDARLAALEGSAERRARIRARVTEQQEEPQVKRKLSMAMVVAIAMMIALSGIAVAEIAGLNLFGYFAQNTTQEKERWDIDQRTLDHLQGASTLVSTSGALEVKALEGHIRIQDAYYDGDVLFLSTIISGWETSRALFEWMPTEEELAGHEPETWPLWPNDESPYEQEQPFIDAMNEAQKNGEPYGYKVYQYHRRFTPHYRTSEGTPLWSVGGRYKEVDGETYLIEQMQAPLPEEIRQKETIEIGLTVPISVEYLWFDGTEQYYWSEEADQVVETATIARSADTPQRHYQSKPGTLKGVAVTAEATASTYLLHVTLHAEEPIFLYEPLGEDYMHDPWDLSILDGGTREELRIMYPGLSYGSGPDGQMIFGFYDGGLAYGKASDEQRFICYETISEDGMTCERYMSLGNGIPDSLIVTVSKDYRKQTAFVLNPVD